MTAHVSANDDYEQELMNNMILGIKGWGVTSGLAVSQRGAGANMSVDVASGQAIIDELTVNKTSTTNVAVTAAHATLDRYDLVVINKSGTISVQAGTPAANPESPNYDFEANNAILLAELFIPALDTAVEDSQISDKRIIIQIENFLPLNVGLDMLIELLKNSAEGGITPIDYEDIEVDYFSDSTGYKNTVDLGGTSAIFDVNKYRYSTGVAATIGTTAATGSGANYFWATKYVAGSTYTATKLGVNWSTGGNGQFKAAIYSDDSGPDALLGYTTSGNTAGGWVDQDLNTGVSITNGVTYWLVINHNNGSDIFYELGSGGSGIERLAAWGYGAFTDPAPGGLTPVAGREANMRLSSAVDTHVRTNNILGTTATQVQVQINSPSDSTIRVDVLDHSNNPVDTDINLDERVTLSTPLTAGGKLKFYTEAAGLEDIDSYSVAWW
ncbi:hypothetical protein KAR91_44560 [Candidatus Pacearchaeota archaeon]|nr:hypothetical protein [Candidatus Pacearchaeota archaeon]